jgi:hypothetical protein
MHAERVTSLVGAHRPAREELVEAVGGLLGHVSRPAGVGEAAEREDREVTGRNDVCAEPRSPDLHEGWVLPAGGAGRLDASMDREQRGSGHAVLEAHPSGLPE